MLYYASDDQIVRLGVECSVELDLSAILPIYSLNRFSFDVNEHTTMSD